MAIAQTAKWAQVTVKVDFGAGLVLICGLTARSIEREFEITRTEIPDCADESLPLQVGKAIKSVDWKMTGSGVYDRALNTELSKWEDTGQTKSVQVEYLDAVAIGDLQTVTGPALLAGWTDNGEHGDIYKLDMSIEWDGTPVKVYMT